MLGAFLDKKSLQEITNIFKQHVQYQYSQKDEMVDISVYQQDKINRFLNCYQQHFSDYLLEDNTYQHFDYYRILSKYIKVFNFEKGQKFKRNHYDGLYLILKGYIQEITISEDTQPKEEPQNQKSTKTKKKQQEQQKMQKIVSMVMGIQRMKGSSNDVSSNTSDEIIATQNNFMDESQNTDIHLTENNQKSNNAFSLAGITNSLLNINKKSLTDAQNFNLIQGVQTLDEIPQSPKLTSKEQKNVKQFKNQRQNDSDDIQNDQFILEKQDQKPARNKQDSLQVYNQESILRNEMFKQQQNNTDIKEIKIQIPAQNIIKSERMELQNGIEDNLNSSFQNKTPENRDSLKNGIQDEDINNQQQIPCQEKQKPTKRILFLNIKDQKHKFKRQETDVVDEKGDDVHELINPSINQSPLKSPSKLYTSKFNQNSGEKSSQENSNLQKAITFQNLNQLDPIQSSPMQVEIKTPLSSASSKTRLKRNSTLSITSQIISHHPLKKRLSFLIASQPQSSIPFPQYSDKPQRILQSGELIDLTKVTDQQRKYFVTEFEDCVCLYIGKKSMQKAFKEQIIQLRYKTSVLEKFFQNVPSNKILKLAYHFYEKTMFKNQFLYKEGDSKPHFIYIVKSGEVQISENFKSPKNNQDIKDLDKKNNISNKNSQNTDKIKNEKDKPESNQELKKQQEKSDQDELQQLCRKQLNKQKQNNLITQKVTQIQKQQKVFYTLGEEEIFGIEEIVHQKEFREHSVSITSSQAEFYVIPEDLFEYFRQTESDSILYWFKQKEYFLEQQRGLHQRVKGDGSSDASQNQNIINSKKLKQACQYLFQEDEDTFKTRLDQLHQKKVIQLKNYNAYKKYNETSQNKSQLSQSIQQSSINDSQNINSPKNQSIFPDKIYLTPRQSKLNTGQYRPQSSNPSSQLQLKQAQLLSKIIAKAQLQYSQNYSQLNQTQDDIQNKQINISSNKETLKNNLILNIPSDINKTQPYYSPNLHSNRSININASSPTGSTCSVNYQGNEFKLNQIDYILPKSTGKMQNSTNVFFKDQIDSQTKIQLSKQYSKRFSGSQVNVQGELSLNQAIQQQIQYFNYQTNNQQQNSQQHVNQQQSNQQQNNYQQSTQQPNNQNDKNVEQYRKIVSRSDQAKRYLSAQQRQEYFVSKGNIKFSNKGKTESSQLQEQDRSQQQLKLEASQSVLGPPPSLEYVSNNNIVQSSSQNVNLGRIQEMVKNNTQIVKLKLNIKGKSQFFKTPIFDELKKENIRQAMKIDQKRTSIIQENEPKPYQPLSERWKNKSKNMENVQKYQDLIKSSQNIQSLNNLNSPSIKEIPSSSYFNLQSPKTFQSPIQNPSKSLTQIESSQSPVVNIHMQNKRKIEKQSDPYFTRPFSRADQRSLGENSNSNIRSHRVLQSASTKRRFNYESDDSDTQLQYQSKNRIETKNQQTNQSKQISMFSLVIDKQPTHQYTQSNN